MRKFKIFSYALLILILLLGTCSKRKHDLAANLEHFFEKEKVVIAVTDSGLGGLSIMAELAEKIKEAGIFRQVDLIFFNALFSTEGGYNSLKTSREKVLIFNSALKSLGKKSHPDLILIGCNTLSTLYGKTKFSRKTSIPVVGIIEAGTELISSSLRDIPDSKVIIFATQTTIEEANYQSELRKQGFADERYITQACPELVNYIERGPESEETAMLITAYVGEALQNLEPPQVPLFVSLNCTHYGYSLPLWKKAFSEYGISPLAYLNPNSRMIQFLLEQKKGRFQRTEINTSVLSMVEISIERINSISAWLRTFSPQTASALENYQLEKNLFEWKRFVADRR
ncbi:MAG: aspartate/glutamate racemase family protein [Candidatus Aminicenantales bacterium]